MVGRKPEAVELLREVVRCRHTTVGHDHPSTLHGIYRLSKLLVEEGHLEDAAAALGDAPTVAATALGSADTVSLQLTAVAEELRASIAAVGSEACGAALRRLEQLVPQLAERDGESAAHAKALRESIERLKSRGGD
jgi:hypothetical protein